MTKLTKRLNRRGICCAVISVVLNTLAFAEPMMQATLKEGLQQSPNVVIAHYIDYDRQSPAAYFSGVKSKYQVESVLKGNTFSKGSVINVQYWFHDGSPCMEPDDWRFNPAQDMPKKDSRWILFLTGKRNKTTAYDTYRGDYGRWRADPAKITEVTKAIGGHKK
jgi:hypothetical protein